MKTLGFFITACLMCSYAMSNPAIPPIDWFLQQEINYPDFAKLNNEQGTVLVNFSVDQNGKILVKQTNSDNDALCNYVVRKLTALMLSNPEEANREYNMKFVFRLL